jgi:hypothetical protein
MGRVQMLCIFEMRGEEVRWFDGKYRRQRPVFSHCLFGKWVIRSTGDYVTLQNKGAGGADVISGRASYMTTIMEGIERAICRPYSTTLLDQQLSCEVKSVRQSTEKDCEGRGSIPMK